MAKIIKAYTPITAGIESFDEINVPMLINEYIDKIGTGFHTPYICVVNEKPISRAYWSSLIIQKNDVVLFLAFPQGGGEGGSDPMRAIISIAIMAAAVAVPGLGIFAGSGLFTGVFGGALGAGTFGGALMSGAIMFGGTALLNVAFPPESPNQIQEQSRQGTSLSSYNINDRGNTAALGEVITVQYGRIKHYPKYAMQSWNEFIDNEQYAYLLFCQGQGEYEFEEFNFGTVSSEELQNIQINTIINDNDVILLSDGTTWANKSNGVNDLQAVDGYGDYLVAAGDAGSLEVSSDNGETWISRTPAGSYTDNFYGVSCWDSRYIIVGETGEIQSSSNQISWTQRTPDGGFTGTFYAATNNGSLFVIAGEDGEIQTSADGFTWAQRTSGLTTEDIKGLTYAEGLFVAVGTVGVILTSTDGITWVPRTPDDSFADTFEDVTYGHGKYIAVGGATTAEIQTSADGITWVQTIISGTINYLNSVTYNGEIHIAVGSNAEIITSKDSGVKWNRQVAGSSFTGDFYGVYKDVAVGAVGEIQKAASETFYDNVFTSEQVQNVELKKVGAFQAGPSDTLWSFRNTTSAYVPFDNYIWGYPVSNCDGFVAGDKIMINDPDTSYSEEFTIKSTYYATILIPPDITPNWPVVAYELVEPVPFQGYLTENIAYLEFVPGEASLGFLIPNRNSIIQKGSVDIALPNGLYKINETTGDLESAEVNFSIEFKEIEADGIEPTVWDDTGVQTISAASKTPIYKTYDIPITSSATQKIRVRISRDYGTPAEYTELEKSVTTMAWTGLKAFLPNTTNYGDVTMIPIKVKTTNSIVQATLSKFNTISTRKLPIYTTSWSDPTATRNPAWAMADACRNSEYSVAVPDADIDITELVALAATFTSRGDYCDGLFESKEVFWDALRKICKVGRAQPLMVAGSVSFARDEPKTVPRQVFTSDNIQFNSFNVDYVQFDSETPDSVEMEYFDEDEWVWKKTLQTVPSGTTTKPALIKKWGITTEDHAIRDAKYETACNLYRRKLPNFTSELEGRILKRLDYISISSPRVGWGISGHIVNVDGNELELSEPIEFGTGTHYIALRQKNGTQAGPYVVTEVSGEPTKVLMGSTPPSFIYTGYDYEKTMFQFGEGSDYDKKALVATIQPQQLESVQITCIIDDSRVYTADGTTGL